MYLLRDRQLSDLNACSRLPASGLVQNNERVTLMTNDNKRSKNYFKHRIPQVYQFLGHKIGRSNLFEYASLSSTL